jgi:hypothetical protein
LHCNESPHDENGTESATKKLLKTALCGQRFFAFLFFTFKPSLLSGLLNGLLGQNQFAQLGGLQFVHRAVVANFYRFLALQQLLAGQGLGTDQPERRGGKLGGRWAGAGLHAVVLRVGDG